MSDKQSERLAQDVPEAFAGSRDRDSICCDETGGNKTTVEITPDEAIKATCV